MEKLFLTKVLSFGRVVGEWQVLDVTLISDKGQMEVLPMHTDFMGTLGYGILSVHLSQEEWLDYCVLGGLFEVQEGVLTILADSIETVKEIDKYRALESYQRAVDRLESRSLEVDVDRALRAKARARARLDVLAYH